jgi:hypothetical protein
VLFSAPASATLDALYASLAPALKGEPFKTPATAAFKNVLDDLSLPDNGELGGNGKQQSAAVPEPASKKQQPRAAGSLTDMGAAPQTSGIKLPPARLASPQAAGNLLSDGNAAQDAERSQPAEGDSARTQPLDDQAIAIAMQPQAAPLEPEETILHATAPTAKTSAIRSFLAPVSFGTVAAREPLRGASLPQAPARSVYPASVATAPKPAETIETPSTSVAAAPTHAPSENTISNPGPPLVRPVQQAATNKLPPTASINQETPHVIDQNEPVPVVTTRLTKSSPPAGRSVPFAPESARTNTTPAVSPAAPPPIRPDAIATLPVPASTEVPSAKFDAIGASMATAEPAIAPSQMPAATPRISDTVPERQPASRLSARASSFTTPSTTPAFLTAPAPLAPTFEQTLQPQTAAPVTGTSSTAPNMEQPAEPQAPAVPASSPVTSVPVAAAAHTAISQQGLDRPGQPAVPMNSPGETPGATPDTKSPLLPQAANFAFAVRLLGLDEDSSRVPLTQSAASSGNGDLPVTPSVTQTKQAAPQTQNSPAQQTATPPGQNVNQPNANQQGASQQNANQATHESGPAAATTGKPEPLAQSQPEISAAPILAQPSHPGGAPVFQFAQQGLPVESSASGLQHSEAPEPHVLLAAQETHLGGPDLSRSNTSSEILLHLTGNDQSPAAIRVADRAGSVSVSVHAADPILRESLKTNLGDLSAQLNMQGWKTETTKSAAVAAHSDTPQDSHSGGQRGSGQQTSGGERQPQRERRGNGGQWRQALDQQITGNETHPGGNR